MGIKAHLCFDNYLYEIEKDQSLVRRNPIKDSGRFYNSSASFKRGKYIYFVLEGPILYRIDTKDKVLEKIEIH